MKGRVFKRCHCINPDTGRERGQTCPQLRRPTGTWRADHGSWSYRVDLPPHPDGRRRQTGRNGLPLRADATTDLERIDALLAIPDPGDRPGQQAIADLIATANTAGRPLPEVDEVRARYRHNTVPDTDLTVAEWLTRWLAGRKKIRPTTRRGYEQYIRVHLIPALGDIPLARLSVTHLDHMFTAIDTTNAAILADRQSDDPAVAHAARLRRTTGPATQQRIRGALRAALNDAIHRGLITTNPAKHVELASGKRPKALLWTDARVERWRATGTKPSPVMVWTPTHTGAFLDHAAPDPLYPIFHLIAYRGLRRGEALGLHWDDVDLDRASLTIRWQITQIGYTTQLGAPKSDAGDRVIPLDPDTVAMLTTRRAQQNRDRLALGPTWPDTGLVFTHPDGQPIHPEHLGNRFRALQAETDLPPVRLHDLRHGAASLALAAGADLKAVQELLGHATIVLTADTYTHLLPDIATDIATNAARLIPRTHRAGTGPDDRRGETAG